MSKIGFYKHGFFNKSFNSSQKLSFKDKHFNLNQLSSEFSSVYRLVDLNKKNLKKDSEVVLYLNWLCNQLILYFQCDFVADELKILLEKKQKIELDFADYNSFKFQDFRSFLLYKMKNNFKEFIYLLKSSSRFRSTISSLLTNRSYWNYSRSFAKYLTLYCLQCSSSHLFRKINGYLGLYCSPERFLEIIELPKEILKITSFSFNLFRLLINLIMAIKHIYKALLNQELSAKKILVQELEKRSYIVTNDVAWSVVNFLSNYYQVLGISIGIISYLNLACFTLDFVLFSAKWAYEKLQYDQRINELILQRNQSKSTLESAMIIRQIELINDDWEAQCHYYLFNIAAALIFIFAFAATLIWTGPLFFLGIAALNMLGNALYNSSEEYKFYKQATIAGKRELLNKEFSGPGYHNAVLHELNEKSLEAQNEFIKTLIFNAVFTTSIMVVASFSWPLATLIMVTYLAYKIWDSYEKEQKKQFKKPEPNIYRLFSPKQKEPDYSNDYIALGLS
ncbi:MAG: hypothetical protein H0U57_14770 [Tatlockia sp.]|nr:hypothetical protein [Tatlockia sp.]